MGLDSAIVMRTARYKSAFAIHTIHGLFRGQKRSVVFTCLDDGNVCKVLPVTQFQCRPEVAGRDRIVDQLNLFLQCHFYGPAGVR